MNQKIELKFTTEQDLQALFAYSLPEDQINFTALPQLAFERLAARTDDFANPVTILQIQ